MYLGLTVKYLLSALQDKDTLLAAQALAIQCQQSHKPANSMKFVVLAERILYEATSRILFDDSLSVDLIDRQLAELMRIVDNYTENSVKSVLSPACYRVRAIALYKFVFFLVRCRMASIAVMSISLLFFFYFADTEDGHRLFNVWKALWLSQKKLQLALQQWM